MIISKSEALRAADAAFRSYQEQSLDLEEQSIALRRLAQQQAGELAKTGADLAAFLLPRNETEDIQRAAEHLRAPEFGARPKEFEEDRQGYARRLAEIEADERFCARQDILAHDADASAALQAELATLSARALRFESPEFNLLRARTLQRRGAQQPFQRFYRAITLTDAREQALLEKLLPELAFESFGDCLEAYQEIRRELDSKSARVEQREAHRKAVVALVEEHDALARCLEGCPEEATLRALHIELAGRLFGSDLDDLHERLSPEGKLLVARFHAGHQKACLLNRIEVQLREEQRDRERRAEGIARLREPWLRRPLGRLLGNVTSCLIELPSLKAEASKRLLSWARELGPRIHAFDDDEQYSQVMAREEDFSPLELFLAAGESPLKSVSVPAHLRKLCPPPTDQRFEPLAEAQRRRTLRPGEQTLRQDEETAVAIAEAEAEANEAARTLRSEQQRANQAERSL